MGVVLCSYLVAAVAQAAGWLMKWWWRLTDVKFQGPWKQSDWLLIVRAENETQAAEAMDYIASEWPEEVWRISLIPSNPQGGFDSEQEARAAAAAYLKRLWQPTGKPALV